MAADVMTNDKSPERKASRSSLKVLAKADGDARKTSSKLSIRIKKYFDEKVRTD